MYVASKFVDIVGASNRAIGKEDTKGWLDDINDILTNPYFVKDPTYFIIDSHPKSKEKFYSEHPDLKNKTWVTFHCRIFDCLGIYVIRRPQSEPEFTRNNDKVRLVLLEN